MYRLSAYSAQTTSPPRRQVIEPREAQFHDPNFNPHIFFVENSIFQTYHLLKGDVKQVLCYHRKPCKHRKKVSRREIIHTSYGVDFRKTVHAQHRKQQRGISDKKIEFMLTHGKMYYINSSVHVRMTESECEYMKTEFLKRKHDEWTQAKSQGKFNVERLDRHDLAYLKWLDEFKSKNKAFTVVLTADTQTILTVYYSDTRLKRP